VPRPLISRATLALALLACAGPARAAVSFVHAASVYEDDKRRPLKDVEGVACAGDGRFLVADTGNGRILEYQLAGKEVRGGVEYRIPELPYPTQIQLDAKGGVYVLDRKVQRIGRLDAKGAFFGYVQLKGTLAPEGVIPGGLKVDPSGNLVVLDLASVKVLVADPTGNVLRAVELPRTGTLFTDVALDAAGRLYAVDAKGPSVWVAEKGAAAFKPLVKDLSDSTTFPIYGTVLGGRLLLVDQHGQGLVVLGLDGAFQGRFLAMGWSEGAVYYPSQLCVTDTGTAILADRGNHRVQVFTMTQ
jgi:streptogramin lyase